jgi:hypothetical protein
VSTKLSTNHVMCVTKKDSFAGERIRFGEKDDDPSTDVSGVGIRVVPYIQALAVIVLGFVSKDANEIFY